MNNEMTQFNRLMREVLDRMPSYNSNAEAYAALGAGKPYKAGANHQTEYPGKILTTFAE